MSLRGNHCSICILFCLICNHCFICIYCVWDGTIAIFVSYCVWKGTIVPSVLIVSEKEPILYLYYVVSEREPLFYLIPLCLRGNHCSILSQCVWEGTIVLSYPIVSERESFVNMGGYIGSEREPLLHFILLCLRGSHCSILSYCVWEGTIAMFASYWVWEGTIALSYHIVSEREPLLYLYPIRYVWEVSYYCLSGNHCSILSYCVWVGGNHYFW